MFMMSGLNIMIGYKRKPEFKFYFHTIHLSAEDYMPALFSLGCYGH